MSSEQDNTETSKNELGSNGTNQNIVISDTDNVINTCNSEPDQILDKIQINDLVEDPAHNTQERFVIETVIERMNVDCSDETITKDKVDIVSICKNKITDSCNQVTTPDGNILNYQNKLNSDTGCKINDSESSIEVGRIDNYKLQPKEDSNCVRNANKELNNQDILIEQNVANCEDDIVRKGIKRKKVELNAKDIGPHWYNVKSNLVTPPFITANLPKAFASLPITGRPEHKALNESYLLHKIRDFVGCDLDDEEFDELTKYCSPDHLRTGKELVMNTKIPLIGFLTPQEKKDNAMTPVTKVDDELSVVKKYKQKDKDDEFSKKLKYRGLRLMPILQARDGASTSAGIQEEPLEPGTDIIYRVRVYRPFMYSILKDRNVKVRHSVFSCDIVLVGQQMLTALRDRIVCQNDVDMRIDVSNTPDNLPLNTAKEAFPSGFLFINNVFYVDTREGCVDHSAVVREWAARRGMGHFPCRDMCSVRLDELVVKLGYPEVYVHQGNCEHLFTFSEVRLLNLADPMYISQYPCHTAVSQNQNVYCTTCAEFSAKWIVVGCDRVPFDPAFFCDTCFKLYLYIDGQKIGDFKAFSYRGNEINMLKPHG